MVACRPKYADQPRWKRRRGLTLTELLVASTIMVMIAGAMSMLAMTVHSSNDHCQGQTIAAQHGRVILERISRAVAGATANEQFPGAIVVEESVGSLHLPQTLVIWSPESAPADAAGLPRVEELVLFTTDPDQPNVLLEIRDPGNSAIVPAVSSGSSWRTLVATLRAKLSAERIVITDRLRTGAVTTPDPGNPAASLRGCLRFVQLMTPAEDEWEDYRAGDLNWDDLGWPLDAYGTQSGTRRVVIQTEVQLSPSDEDEEIALPGVPFFGSAAVVYHLER